MAVAIASDVAAVPATLAAVALWLLDEKARAARPGRAPSTGWAGTGSSTCGASGRLDDDHAALVAPDPDVRPYA